MIYPSSVLNVRYGDFADEEFRVIYFRSVKLKYTFHYVNRTTLFSITQNTRVQTSDPWVLGCLDTLPPTDYLPLGEGVGGRS